MAEATGGPEAHRRAHAIGRDTGILSAVRERLVERPDSSMAELAAHAEVGMSALYSRFGSKDELLRRLADEGRDLWRRALDDAHDALDRGDDAWQVLTTFLRTADAGDVMALGALLGRHLPRDRAEDRAMRALSRRGDELVARLQAAGALRAGVTSDDLGKVLEAVGAVRGDGRARSAALQRRMLDIAIEGLRPSLPALDGVAPTQRDF